LLRWKACFGLVFWIGDWSVCRLREKKGKYGNLREIKGKMGRGKECLECTKKAARTQLRAKYA
jgi:hypothetical protein